MSTHLTQYKLLLHSWHPHERAIAEALRQVPRSRMATRMRDLAKVGLTRVVPPVDWRTSISDDSDNVTRVTFIVDASADADLTAALALVPRRNHCAALIDLMTAGLLAPSASIPSDTKTASATIPASATNPPAPIAPPPTKATSPTKPAIANEPIAIETIATSAAADDYLPPVGPDGPDWAWLRENL